MILYGAVVKWLASEDFPLGIPDAVYDLMVQHVEENFADGMPLALFAPSVAENPAAKRWWAEQQRLASSPGAMKAMMNANRTLDVRGVVRDVRVPTLVLHRAGDLAIKVEHGRFDARWRDLIATHDAAAAREVDRHRGVFVKSTGDGIVATFDGPARAIRCAAALRDVAGSLGLQIRAGLHTGEIERVGEDIAGIAVHIAARVASAAGPRDVFVTSTVRDLVAGSGLEFVEHGPASLKGVPGTWTLHVLDG